jgi:hypothetical protein
MTNFDSKLGFMKAFFFIIFCFCFLSNNAQVLNQVGSSIKNGATTKASDFNRSRSNKEKNDLNKNNSQKATETEDLEESSGESPNPSEGSTERIDIDYSFSHRLDYETINYVDGVQGEIKQMSYFFGDSSSLLNTGGAFMLNDIRSKKTFILNEESKTGFLAPSPETGAEAIGDDMSREIYGFKKSGNTKDIMGYRCEEYVLVREDKKLIAIWSATESPLKKDQLDPKLLNDQLILGINALNPDPNGYVMEFNQFGDDEQLVNTIRVSAFEAVERVIHLGEYEISTY